MFLVTWDLRYCFRITPAARSFFPTHRASNVFHPCSCVGHEKRRTYKCGTPGIPIGNAKSRNRLVTSSCGRWIAPLFRPAHLTQGQSSSTLPLTITAESVEHSIRRIFDFRQKNTKIFRMKLRQRSPNLLGNMADCMGQSKGASSEPRCQCYYTPISSNCFKHVVTEIFELIFFFSCAAIR